MAIGIKSIREKGIKSIRAKSVALFLRFQFFRILQHMVLPLDWLHKNFIEKYPDFVSVRTEREGIPDKRVLIVKPGEYLRLNRLEFSYTELRTAARIIQLQSDK